MSARRAARGAARRALARRSAAARPGATRRTALHGPRRAGGRRRPRGATRRGGPRRAAGRRVARGACVIPCGSARFAAFARVVGQALTRGHRVRVLAGRHRIAPAAGRRVTLRFEIAPRRRGRRTRRAGIRSRRGELVQAADGGAPRYQHRQCQGDPRHASARGRRDASQPPDHLTSVSRGPTAGATARPIRSRSEYVRSAANLP